MPAPKAPNTAAAREAAAVTFAKRREEKAARELLDAAEKLRAAGWVEPGSPAEQNGHGGKSCGCGRAAQHQADADTVARVRELLSQWEGPEGWTDVEGNQTWDEGYKTAWRERAAELRDALNPSA